MKTFIPFSVALLLGTAAISTPSMAQQKVSNADYYVEQPRLTAAVFPSSDPLKLWMVVEKEDPTANLTIELLDAKNHRLHLDMLDRRTNKIRQRFDLSNMPDGNYTFRITAGNTTQERTFKLSSPGLSEQLPKRLVTMN